MKAEKYILHLYLGLRKLNQWGVKHEVDVVKKKTQVVPLDFLSAWARQHPAQSTTSEHNI